VPACGICLMSLSSADGINASELTTPG
jgi:hypothetical protein